MEPLKKSYWEAGGKGDIAGMLAVDAEAAMKKEGFQLRISIEDGKHLNVTDDSRALRANVEVTNGKVDRIINWG